MVLATRHLEVDAANFVSASFALSISSAQKGARTHTVRPVAGLYASTTFQSLGIVGQIGRIYAGGRRRQQCSGGEAGAASNGLFRADRLSLDLCRLFCPLDLCRVGRLYKVRARLQSLLEHHIAVLISAQHRCLITPAGVAESLACKMKKMGQTRNRLLSCNPWVPIR